ncbi:MAG TPA: NAD(+) synthase [Candidatus Faecaligallichristensenella faecipullorum]|nr:NAD(+) synthase [Candidatus Faecaligallichristensenella faecipullorum]
MKDGYIRVGAATPPMHLGDCAANAREMIALMRQAHERKVKILAFPELSLTGYTLGDLFLQRALLDGALSGLEEVVKASSELDMVAVVGLPLSVGGRLYNCAAVVSKGAILGVVPKRNPPNYGEFYELRHFAPGPDSVKRIRLLNQEVPFGGKLLFTLAEMPELKMGVEVCEDLWVPAAPGVEHALAGATLIVNPSASDETIGKADYRKMLLMSQSARLLCGYLYCDAGPGESTTDMVFAGHNLIAENGKILSESRRYEGGLLTTEIDILDMEYERRRMNTFTSGRAEAGYEEIPFSLTLEPLELTRPVDAHPFVPQDPGERARRCEEILNIQTQGLMQRLRHTHCESAVIGVSGGLDSTLALLVAARAFEALHLPADGVLAVTMPCFGTTSRTRNNALELARQLGAQVKEVNIAEAVRVHFRDIGHDEAVHDVTFENSQARERTQVLMDLANKTNGMVIGTGDLSELALGWATYNGDHMSMYGVNASVPKTLVRHLVEYAASETGNAVLKGVLEDILATPVSPELLPPVNGEIAQCTEELVGPYELHDFYLYHVVRKGERPAKIFRLAQIAFEGRYDQATLLKWLKSFYWRFFAQQFKRSCVPDGPKVGSVTLSPRGDWRMPSDAVVRLWRAELGSIEL